MRMYHRLLIRMVSFVRQLSFYVLRKNCDFVSYMHNLPVFTFNALCSITRNLRVCFRPHLAFYFNVKSAKNCTEHTNRKHCHIVSIVNIIIFSQLQIYTTVLSANKYQFSCHEHHFIIPTYSRLSYSVLEKRRQGM